MAGITWLHLSDWHQGRPKKKEEFDREVVRDKLIEDIKNRNNISADLAKIDFIIFSGDVAFSGKKEEYEAAQKNFFDPVLEAAGLPTNRLFIVPGNHDLDRDAFELLPDFIRQPFDSNDLVKEWLTNEKKRDRLREPFEAYKKFVTQYTHQTQPDYSSIYTLQIGGTRVALLGLNSALMAGRNKNRSGEVDDYGKQIVGEPQVYDALHKIASHKVRIAVLHHPLEWLAEFDRDRITQLLQGNDGCHFLLCGHQHKGGVYQVNGTRGNCVIIPAGSSYDRRDYPNGYNFVHLDLENSKGTVYLRCWSDRSNKWFKDIESTEDDGQVLFELPEKNIALPPICYEPEPSSAAKVDLKTHFTELIPEIIAGSVVPFLGADINLLCDRSQDANLNPREWDWNPQSDYPPTSTELAAYLDQSHEYLKAVRCPLCDTETLPPGCPIMTELVTRLDLQHVSQYFDIQGGEKIEETIAEIAKPKKYNKPNSLYEFLAQLPRLMKNMDYSTHTSSEATPYQLIVTTNFDSTLEDTFIKNKQPFDLISYTVEKHKHKQFVHQTFEYEIEGDEQSPAVVKKYEQGITPGVAHQYSYPFCKERPVILKLYGPVDWPEHSIDNFAITEDHFIDYLAYNDSYPQHILPSSLLKKLGESNIWFLGYSLRYWHQRVILRRIWPTGINEKCWAIHPKPNDLDRNLWKSNHVNLISQTSLKDYVKKLDEGIKSRRYEINN